MLFALAYALSDATYRIYENPIRHARRCGTAAVAGAVAGEPDGGGARLDAGVILADGAQGGGGAPERQRGRVRLEGREPLLPLPKRIERAVVGSLSPQRLRAPVPNALAPSLDNLLHDVVDLRGCNAGHETTSRICHWGDSRSPRTAVAIGDSHGQMWMPAFTEFARRRHMRLVPLIKDGCGAERCCAAAAIARTGTPGCWGRCGG